MHPVRFSREDQVLNELNIVLTCYLAAPSLVVHVTKVLWWAWAKKTLTSGMGFDRYYPMKLLTVLTVTKLSPSEEY